MSYTTKVVVVVHSYNAIKWFIERNYPYIQGIWLSRSFDMSCMSYLKAISVENPHRRR